jgi:NTE family protein
MLCQVHVGLADRPRASQSYPFGQRTNEHPDDPSSIGDGKDPISPQTEGRAYPRAMASKGSTAFVLGGGGVLGAAEVGMLRALLERDIIPDLVVGSSVGALNGAFIAAEPSLTSVDRMVDVWTGLSDRGVFGGSVFGQLSTLARHGTHLHSNDGLRQLIDGELGSLEFSDLRVRFECVAASIERATATWFSSGLVTPAVLASCAVPGLLPAVEINGEHYLDGGLVHSVPIGRAAELGAKRIFVLHVGRLEQPLKPPTRPWQVALVAFEIARRHQFGEELARMAGAVDVNVLPSGSTAPGLTMRYRNTSGVPARIEAAHEAASAYLDAKSAP